MNSPTSFVQEQMWLVDQVVGPGPLVAPGLLARLHGDLDAAALSNAINNVLSRHDVLRTTYRLGDHGRVVQVVGERPPEIETRDLSADRGSSWERVCREETMHRPFDLAHDPPVRALLLIVGPQDHVLLVVRHHIAWDGESGRIFAEELSEAYAAEIGSRDLSTAAPHRQYADAARAQREDLVGDRLERLVQTCVEHVGAVPDLPVAPRAPGRGATVVPVEVPFPDATTTAVRAASRSLRVSPYVLLSAVFRSWWSCAVGVDSLLVAVPTSGRRPGDHGVIGPLVNLVVNRNDVAPGSTVREVVVAERGVTMSAIARQELPFELLARRLGRSVSHPMVQVSFTYQPGGLPPLVLTGLEVEEIDLGVSGGSILELMVAVGVADDRLCAEFVHRDPRDAAVVAAMARSFVDFVATAVSDLDANLDSLGVSPVELWRPLAETPARGEPPSAAGGLVTWMAFDPGPPPRTAIEREVLRLWEEVLETTVDGVEVSFYSLGGHSLLAAQLSALVYQSLGLDMPTALLLDLPTIATQARHLQHAMTQLIEEVGSESVATLIARAESRGARHAGTRDLG